MNNITKSIVLTVQQTKDALEGLVTALGILHKYAINLLKQHRPARWRDICLFNPTFSQKVDTVKVRLSKMMTNYVKGRGHDILIDFYPMGCVVVCSWIYVNHL